MLYIAHFDIFQKEGIAQLAYRPTVSKWNASHTLTHMYNKYCTTSETVDKSNNDNTCTVE